MLMEFFNKTTEQSFLKALLSATQLPKYKVVKDKDFILEDFFYIYDGMIIKCTESGFIHPEQLTLDTVEWGDYINPPSAQYSIIGHYDFLSMDQNVESKEFIRASYYSTELHKKFGDYLRVLRDLYYVDLMGMYNCFSYEVLNDVHLETVNGDVELVHTTDPTKKVIAVPVRFNTEYLIALTSQQPVKMLPIYKLANKKVSFSEMGFQDVQINVGMEGIKFDNPVHFKMDLYDGQEDFSDAKNKYRLERYLYLIMQLDATNNSSIVVLEGQYRNYNSMTVINANSQDAIDASKEGIIPQDFSQTKNTIPLIYKPKLLQMNDGNSYAYSNTIIQYLLRNAISNTEVLDDNISYVKTLLGFPETINYWQNSVKYSAFLKYLLGVRTTESEQPSTPKVRTDCEDVTGYIDRQIEGWLNGYMEV